MPSDNELDFSTTEEDIIAIRLGLEQIRNGECMEAGEFFDGLHKKLLLMKAEQEAKARLQDKQM